MKFNHDDFYWLAFLALFLAVLLLAGCADNLKPAQAIPLAPITSSVATIHAKTAAIHVTAEKAKADIASQNNLAATQDIEDIEVDDSAAEQASVAAQQQIADIAKADSLKSAQITAQNTQIAKIAAQEKSDRWYKTLDLWLVAMAVALVAAFFIYRNFSTIVSLLKLIAL